MGKNFVLSLISVMIFGGVVEARPRDHLYRQFIEQQNIKLGFVAPVQSTVVENTFDQVLNPADPKDTRTYKQRYFIDSSLASGVNPPVFLALCGEWTCSSSELNWLRSYAAIYHAHLISLEHRYYGASQPFTTLTTDNLKYLRTEYAVSDIARFQKYAMTTLGMTGKWVVAGGSYSANLAAYYRLKYPDLVVGALASSAPVQALANFEDYDLHVSKVIAGACGKAVQQTVQKLDMAVLDPSELAKVKALFGASEIKDTGDFMMVAADMVATAVQYGFQNEFCDQMLNATDLLQGYGDAGQTMFANVGETPLADSYQVAESETDFTGNRAWTYQSCTEFGYWQTAYHDPSLAMRSAAVNEDYYNQVCKRVFGFTKPVDTSFINKTFYGPLLAPDVRNIMFTNGSFDPWSELSITNERHNGQSPFLTLFTILAGSHTSDLHMASDNDSASLKQERAEFARVLATWLQ